MAVLSDAGVERIVKAVGSRFSPTDLDRAHLRDALNHCFARYLVDRDRRSKKATDSRSQDARKIAEHAGELCRLLGPDQGTVLILDLLRIYESDELYAGSPEFPAPLDIDSPDAPDLSTMLVGLKALRVCAERVVAMDSEDGDSALFALVTRGLPEVYKKHFRQEKAGRSRSGGGAYGPFIRFASQFGGEVEVEIKPETVSRYLSKSRAMG